MDMALKSMNNQNLFPLFQFIEAKLLRYELLEFQFAGTQKDIICTVVLDQRYFDGSKWHHQRGDPRQVEQ
jgi:hypothetical protein